jgi:hypothetical protein
MTVNDGDNIDLSAYGSAEIPLLKLFFSKTGHAIPAVGVYPPSTLNA